MGGFFSVRNSLLIISGIGTILLLVLTAGFWLDANQQRRDAQLALKSNEIESLFLKSAIHWAGERGLTHAALFDPDPLQPWNQQTIEGHRRSADEALEKALASLSPEQLPQQTRDRIAALSERMAEIVEMRARLEDSLALERPLRDETLEKEWFPAVTGLIVETEKLRLATRFRASAALRDIEALQETKHATAVMWEFAQREIGLVAGIIAADDPVVLEDVERLAEFRGRLLQAWEVVEAFSGRDDADPAIVEQIGRVREDYFAAFEEIRGPIVRAGTEGDIYPVTAVEWIHQSDAAIAPILALGAILESTAADLTMARQADGERWVLGASVILALTVLIGGFSMWIVIRWIIRPLAGITRAMTTLAEGGVEVEIPSTLAKNEIGEMARAVSSFKESLEEQAREVSQANAKLKGLNEELEDRVRQRTEELRSTRDEAIQANRAKSQFLANMSHELRTPLNAIIGFSEVLVEKVDLKGPKDFRDPLSRIATAGQHLLRLINDVLDLAKIEAGKMELELEPVALGLLFEEVATTVRPMTEQNENTLELDYPEGLRLVRADPVRLRQILLNLLSNAVKFTEGGRVTLSACERGETMVIAVTDNGIGMSEEQTRNVFMEFVQADTSSTRRYGGTGLGLAISQRFCRIMGGEITAESKLGEGSSFRVVLPLAAAGARAVSPVSKQEARTKAGTADGHGALVLTVDDDPNVIELLSVVLKREGYRVETAMSGTEGLRLAKALVPDVMTLDVLLPDLDGWDVLAALKSNPETENIPVVMLTILDEATRGYTLGAADYITKPIERERLLGALSRVSGGRDQVSILLVEDDEDTRAVVREMLDGACSQFFEAADGIEGLKLLEGERPDVILLDLLMPKMDGFEFLERLRKDDGLRDIPVIIVTAHDLTEEDHRRLNGAVSQIMRKSAFSGPELLTEIRAAVRARLEAIPSSTATAGLRILYVEDNEDNVVLLKGRLESRGFEVLIARDGQEGVEVAWRERPGLILMDMSLPVLDGWDAARQLKADPRSRQIPIIGVSAHAMAGDQEKAIAAGCDDYVTKPIDLHELLQKAEKLMDGSGEVKT